MVMHWKLLSCWLAFWVPGDATQATRSGTGGGGEEGISKLIQIWMHIIKRGQRECESRKIGKKSWKMSFTRRNIIIAIRNHQNSYSYLLWACIRLGLSTINEALGRTTWFLTLPTKLLVTHRSGEKESLSSVAYYLLVSLSDSSA